MTHVITIGPQIDDRPGWTEVVLSTDGNDRASACGILALHLRIGAAVLRVDGVGGVETHNAFRRRGLARQVLDAAIEHMAAGDAALTMLYGIVDFYPKFGYVTAGPDHRLVLPVPDRGSWAPPVGWQVRGFDPTDLPALQVLYAAATADASGVSVREAAYPWERLLAPAPGESEHECRVVVDRAGTVCGYAWRGRGCGFVDDYGTDAPTELILSDVIAADDAAAQVLLDACLDWAREETASTGQTYSHVAMIMPPEGAVAAAAMTRSAVFTQAWIATGGSMVRVLDVERLLRALQPELTRRATAARLPWTGMLRLVTEVGAATLLVGPDRIELLAADDQSDPDAIVDLPQAALARLALGSLPPAAVLAAVVPPSSDDLRRTLETLFPHRNPHLALADRF